MTHISLNACKSTGNKRAANLQSNDEGLGSLDSNYYFKHNVPASDALGDACVWKDHSLFTSFLAQYPSVALKV